MRLLPQPTIPGKTRGIINDHPWTLQCGICGEVLVNTEGRNAATFIILSGYRFCGLEDDSPRRCRGCLDEHAKECRRCAEANR